MLKFLRNSLVQSKHGARSTSNSRTRSHRLQLEFLESRCLLAAMTTPWGDLFDLRMPAASPAGIAAITGNGSAAASRSRADYFPPDSGRGLLLPTPPPADDIGVGNWKDIPAEDYSNSSPPDGDSPGGLIELDTFEARGVPMQATEGPNNKEIRGILEILAGLQYVPVREHASDASDLRALADTPPTAPSATTNSQPLLGDSPEGGMIALISGAPIKESGHDNEPGTAENDALPLHVSVQMESLSGRFHAFEVSTTEAIPAPSPEVPPYPAGPVNAQPVYRPTSPDPPLEPADIGDPGAAPVEMNEDTVSLSSGGHSAADTEPSAGGLPVVGSPTSSLIPYVAAGAILAFYASRSVRSADGRDPDKPKSLLSAFWEIARSRRNGRRWLRTVWKLLSTTS